MTTTADTQILTAHYDDKTVASLLFDFFAVDGDASLDGYLEDRARPLLDGGAATAANIFELREQEVPATPHRARDQPGADGGLRGPALAPPRS